MHLILVLVALPSEVCLLFLHDFAHCALCITFYVTMLQCWVFRVLDMDASMYLKLKDKCFNLKTVK